MFLDVENKLDEWIQELREAGCCVSGFTLKVKVWQILRELAQYNRTFSATDGCLRGFLRRKNLSRIWEFDPDYSQIFEEIEVEKVVELPDLNEESDLYGYIEE